MLNTGLSPVYQPTLDRISVFVTDSNGHLYDKYWDGSKWVWEDQGTPVHGGVFNPSAVYQPTLDRISVFVAGNDGHLYDKYWNVSEWVWEDQGTPVHGGVGMPSAVYQPTLDRISVFVIGENNGHLYDKYWDGSKWVWEDQGDPPGIINLSPGNDTLFYPSAIYQPTLDRISVFVAGNCGRMCLYDKYWDGSKWVWEDQGTPY